MIFLETLHDLWRLLGRRDRLVAAGLVMLIALSGLLEIGGMMFLFGYIHALGGTDGTAVAGGAPDPARLGPITAIYDFVGGGLTGPAYALAAGAVLVGVFLLKNVMWLLSSFLLLRFAMKRYERTAIALFDGYQMMPLEMVRARGTLEPSRILNNVLIVFRSAFVPVLQGLADVAVIAAMMLALFWVIEPGLVIGAGVILAGVAALFLGTTRRLAHALGLQTRQAQAALNSVVNEALRGLLEVRLAGRQNVMHDRFTRVAGSFALADRRSRGLGMMPRALNELVLAAGIAIAATWFSIGGGGLATALPALAVMGFAGLRVTAAAARLTSALQEMRHGEVGRRELFAELRRSAPYLLGNTDCPAVYDEFHDREEEGPSLQLRGKLVLRDIVFSYPGADEKAVNGVSIALAPGSFTAFCGPSGGGKSTLAMIAMGLLRPQSGAVECDGTDVQHHLRAWHSQIGYVGQAPFIAPRSVRENVALGLSGDAIDDAAVWRALEGAAIADWFRSRPEGLETNLGEDGALLSGGQRQRVAIARALYSDPQILVFDEATAALDTATERAVVAAMDRLRGGRTIIAIAHRLSTIRHADMIHFIEGGAVQASGSYDALMATYSPFRVLAGDIDNNNQEMDV